MFRPHPLLSYSSHFLLHTDDHLLILWLTPLAPPPLTLHRPLQFLFFSFVRLFNFYPLLLTLVVSLHSSFSSNCFLLFSYTFPFVSPSHIKLKTGERFFGAIVDADIFLSPRYFIILKLERFSTFSTSNKTSVYHTFLYIDMFHPFGKFGIFTKQST